MSIKVDNLASWRVTLSSFYPNHRLPALSLKGVNFKVTL